MYGIHARAPKSTAPPSLLLCVAFHVVCGRFFLAVRGLFPFCARCLDLVRTFFFLAAFFFPLRVFFFLHAYIYFEAMRAFFFIPLRALKFSLRLMGKFAVRTLQLFSGAFSRNLISVSSHFHIHAHPKPITDLTTAHTRSLDA